MALSHFLCNYIQTLHCYVFVFNCTVWQINYYWSIIKSNLISLPKAKPHRSLWYICNWGMKKYKKYNLFTSKKFKSLPSCDLFENIDWDSFLPVMAIHVIWMKAHSCNKTHLHMIKIVTIPVIIFDLEIWHPYVQYIEVCIVSK